MRAQEGAPNVILMLMDDMGYSDIAPFGAEIDTPNLSDLAEEGYSLTNYHTTPVCSPARASLLTGLNPHRAGYGSVVHIDPGYPGYMMQIGDDVPTIAESFRASGYSTFMVGKWHLTKEAHMNDAADKASWPLQRGFDRYFGSMDGFTTLYHPHRLVRDNSPAVIDEFPDDYFLTDTLTDEALGMIKSLRANDPSKPFFLYFAHQAVHGPIQAKPEDMEKYRGMYERGWDHIRSERFRRQIEQNLFPEGTTLAPRNSEAGLDVEPWESLSEEKKQRFARYMEVYAAAIDNVDQNLGRLIDHLKRTGEYENTIIAFTSDNGGTGEGGADGTRSYFSQFVQAADLPERWQRDVPRDVEHIGGPRAHVHYPRGWAYASNTPFRFYKGHTFEGGIRAPLIVSWPAGLPRTGDDPGIRHQFTYVSDLGLTLLDLAEVPHLEQRHGNPAQETDGTPFSRALKDANSATVRREQYAEFFGNRAFFQDDWKIVTRHQFGAPYEDSEWELYHLGTDPAETNNLAEQHPDVVQRLADEWRRAAWRNTVYPLADDLSLMSVRPSSELPLEDPVTLYPGTPTLERFRSAKLTALRSFSIEMSLEHSDGDAGVLVAHGDQGGGYVFYIEDGELRLSYNQYGRMHRTSAPLAPGAHALTANFTAGPEYDWEILVSIDGTPAARLESVLQLIGMAPFTGISVGVDRGSPVDWDLYERYRSFPYSGRDLAVRYVPGPKAPYNTEVIRQIEEFVERTYE